MARFFLEERGKNQAIFMRKSKKKRMDSLVSTEWIRSIQNMHKVYKQVYEQDKAVGHAVFVLHICILQWQIWRIEDNDDSIQRATLMEQHC